MVEHAAVNRVVEGSSPSSGAILFSSSFLRFWLLPSVPTWQLTPELTPKCVALVNLGKSKQLLPLLVRMVTTRNVKVLKCHERPLPLGSSQQSLLRS